MLVLYKYIIKYWYLLDMCVLMIFCGSCVSLILSMTAARMLLPGGLLAGFLVLGAPRRVLV